MIDERLIGALHLSSGTHEDDPGEAHRVFQASTISALLDGAYEGDVTFAELASRGDFGIGTLNGCDGEMVAIVACGGNVALADFHRLLQEAE